jgi:hypothetical protein
MFHAFRSGVPEFATKLTRFAPTNQLPENRGAHLKAPKVKSPLRSNVDVQGFRTHWEWLNVSKLRHINIFAVLGHRCDFGNIWLSPHAACLPLHASWHVQAQHFVRQQTGDSKWYYTAFISAALLCCVLKIWPENSVYFMVSDLLCSVYAEPSGRAV